MPQRIVIADDHPLVLKGLQDYLTERGHAVLAAASDGKSALKHILKLEPEVAILDIRMPHLSGLEIAKLVKEQSLDTKVVLITFEKDGNLLNQARALNIDAYMLKEFALAEIENCLEALKRGETYFSPDLMDHVEMSSIIDLERLTNTEKRILKHIAMNKTTKEIADELFISYRTVEKHRSNIIKKLNLDQQQNSLLIWAKENQKYLL
ncbi:MAG: response regulator transcription factor [Bacteroidia bacterium]|nr:response regulator transcription factor [Bacteroidia bacterium]MBT8268675.1 response regulator transcription factor [Bacteroidia bacterium]NNF82624.1 response regulator transcription factor [Flavobacteriaceae bacterium]NNK70416.1 response regulator transcription factor [Flavobacteriaceae bacterium]NNL80124.1 response regulator transcription factor [Flavobacteriaceae bacterium]